MTTKLNDANTIYDGRRYKAERLEPTTNTTFATRITDKVNDIALDVRGKCRRDARLAEHIVAEHADVMLDTLCGMTKEDDPTAFPTAFVGKRAAFTPRCKLTSKPVGDVRKKCERRKAQSEEGR